ncbi:hypothetical protein CHLRE_03g172322v5 [Chlamydomonas reinhardtii]|uniref:3CxxC-type domain-containing protein n=1 Tax=Chlamydomonas reinhardtii TaxID=3055 RepID=A0A2K3DX55_CHLRE|nr:uncharacterized protein CHLRE_03g172322v5 [Chlamydomonas reinhardtii]PNW85114.1 hypothetical protein CHLRE_03g172322v5 [Chlamydomonas reinhardtii]
MGKKQTGLTPYQGPKRVFGAFRCEDCRKHWYSGNSWANTGQQCKSCGELVYPYSQRPLEKRDSDDEAVVTTKPHPAALCGKCKQLGYPCTELDSDEEGGGRRRGTYGRDLAGLFGSLRLRLSGVRWQTPDTRRQRSASVFAAPMGLRVRVLSSAP